MHTNTWPVTDERARRAVVLSAGMCVWPQRYRKTGGNQQLNMKREVGGGGGEVGEPDSLTHSSSQNNQC